MVSRPHIVARTATLSVLLASCVLTGCHSSSKSSAPALAFSKVPAAEQESPYKTDISERDYKTDTIEGRATGALLLCRGRSEEHTSELQSLTNLVCRLLLEKKKKK